MSERDKEILSKLAAACEVLPEGKREFLIGYAEGVVAMKKKEQEAKRSEGTQESSESV